jgi:CheY-like chemotaxis protein
MKRTDILVIDDSATIRKLIEMSMRGSMFEPHFSASGADGVELARKLAPSAILLDCVLPDSSAMQVCRQLAAHDRTRGIPVLIVSAKAEQVRPDFRDLAFVVDFIAKPFTGPDLLRRIQRAIGAPPAPSRFDRDHQQRAAKILYARLRDNLALMPAQLAQLAAGPPGPQLAKRLLTPDAVSGILDDLFDLFEEVRSEAERSQQLEPMPPATILDRAPGFSKRVRENRLGSTARRVLTLINGTHSLDEIARRLGIDVREAGVIARDLTDRGLLEDHTASRSRPVVILEPDVVNFQRPLASLLEARPEAPALVPISSVDEMVSTVKRMHPCLVVVNATGESSAFGEAARALRADAALVDVALVAVLDRSVQSDRDDLYSAGFDAVLDKPIIVSELERFIANNRKDELWIRS